MSSAQRAIVKGHTAKANRLPYFAPTREPAKGFSVKVRGRPINIRLPLLDSDANVCMISRRLADQHDLDWEPGNAPVTSSVGQSAALGVLTDPIELCLCEGTEDELHVIAGGPRGMLTMVTDPNPTFDLLLGCPFINQAAADLLFFEGKFAYRPDFVSKGDDERVATIPIHVGLNRSVPVSSVAYVPGEEPQGDRVPATWDNVIARIRGIDAWLVMTGVTPQEEPYLGLGELLFHTYQKIGEQQAVANWGEPSVMRCRDPLFTEAIDSDPQLMQDLAVQQSQLQELVSSTYKYTVNNFRLPWAALHQGMSETIQQLRDSGIDMYPYDELLSELTAHPALRRKIFGSPIQMGANARRCHEMSGVREVWGKLVKTRPQPTRIKYPLHAALVDTMPELYDPSPDSSSVSSDESCTVFPPTMVACLVNAGIEQESWQNYLAKLRGRYAWDAITGTTHEQNSTLGLGELLHEHLQNNGEEGMIVTFGEAPQFPDVPASLYQLALTAIPDAMQALTQHQKMPEGLRDLVHWWPSLPGDDADKRQWINCAQSLRHTLSYLRAQGMLLPDYQILLDLLVDANDITAMQQAFGSPTALANHLGDHRQYIPRSIMDTYLQLLDEPSHEVCMDHRPGGKLAPATNIPLLDQLYMMHHHHLVHNMLFRYEEETAAGCKQVCDWLWDSCIDEIDLIKQVYEATLNDVIQQSQKLQTLLHKHHVHLHNKLNSVWTNDEVHTIRQLLVEAEANNQPLTALCRVAHRLVKHICGTAPKDGCRHCPTLSNELLEEVHAPTGEEDQHHYRQVKEPYLPVVNMTYCADASSHIDAKVKRFTCSIHPQSNHNCEQCTLPCPIHKWGEHTWGECTVLAGKPCPIHPDAFHSEQRCLQPCPLHGEHTWGKCKTLNMGFHNLQDARCDDSSRSSDSTLAADWGGDHKTEQSTHQTPCNQPSDTHSCQTLCTADKQPPAPPVYVRVGLRELQNWVIEMYRWETLVIDGMGISLNERDYDKCFPTDTPEYEHYVRNSKNIWKRVELPHAPMSRVLAQLLLAALPRTGFIRARPWAVLTMNPGSETVIEYAAEVYRVATVHWYVVPEREELVNHFLKGLPPLLHDAAELIQDQPEQYDLEKCAELLQQIWDVRSALESGKIQVTHTIEEVSSDDDYDHFCMFPCLHVCYDSCSSDKELPPPPILRHNKLKELLDWQEELRRWEVIVRQGMKLPLRRSDYQLCFRPRSRESRYFAKNSGKWWRRVIYPHYPFSGILCEEFHRQLPVPPKNSARAWWELSMDPSMQDVTEFAAEVQRSFMRSSYLNLEKQEIMSKFLEGLPPLLYDAQRLIRYGPEESDLDLCAAFLQRIWDIRTGAKEETSSSQPEDMSCHGEWNTMTCLTLHDDEPIYVPLPPEWLLEEGEHNEKFAQKRSELAPQPAIAQSGNSHEESQTPLLTDAPLDTPEPHESTCSTSASIILLAQWALGIWAITKGSQSAAPFLLSATTLTALWASYDRIFRYRMPKDH